MKCCSLLGRIFWAAVIILLWTWEGQIWCNRTRRVFSSAPNAFWKKVELPTDCELAIPMVSTRGLHLGMEKVETDRYSQALLNAASDSRNAHMTLSCDITVVVDLFKQDPERLWRYLACNPGWRFAHTYGRDGAERRVLKDGQWHIQEWEYLQNCENSGDDFEIKSDESQCTITIGDLDFYGTKCKSGESVRLKAGPEDGSQIDCEVVCLGDGISLGVYERTYFPTCRVMQTAFDLTKEEFAKVRNATNWPMLKVAMPEGAVRRGPSTLDLLASGGDDAEVLGYSYQAWINPVEKGETYLRAFEVSQGVELGIPTSMDGGSMKNDTQEYAGWSDDPEEKFLVGSKIFLPGSRRKTYAVRLEVWFAPANGGPERKLVERVFRVKGGGR